jgi:hypothetical protein
MAGTRMKDRNPIEYIATTDAMETTWLRFGRLTSKTLAKRAIALRAAGLEASALERKAEGVASAVRSCLGYWRTPAAALGARVLTRYYALLQASIAEQVASPDPSADLEAVQRHTTNGHGLGVIEESDDFPDKFFVYALSSGHFVAYMKARQHPVTQWALPRRPKAWNDVGAERPKLLSLSELLLRVPEMQQLAPECLERPALSFHVGHDGFGDAGANGLRRPGTEKRSTALATTRASIFVEPTREVTAEWLGGLGLPFRNIAAKTKPLLPHDRPCFVGEVQHPSDELWWDHFPHYKSDYTATSVIAPFWGTADAMALHLMILYGLSIVVRYMPSLWQRVEVGPLDHVHALLEGYLAAFDRVGPAMALNRITGVRLELSQPGGFNSPI